MNSLSWKNKLFFLVLAACKGEGTGLAAVGGARLGPVLPCSLMIKNKTKGSQGVALARQVSETATWSSYFQYALATCLHVTIF